MQMTVVIPTYRRPRDLVRAFDALKLQTRLADEVIVVVRESDTETWKFLENYNFEPLPLNSITITVPGVVAAYNAGLDVAQGDIISIMDDDAAPHTDWLQRIEVHFVENSQLGGLGGRDWMYFNDKLQDASASPGASQTIGKLQWFGRTIGNHHIGEGLPRDVDILKGVNMSFRRDAILKTRFDPRLRGTGAQVGCEIGFSLALKEKGWKLIYDPAVAVDHYPSQRFDEDQRNAFNAIAWANKAHNETVGLLDHLSSPRQIIYLAWAFLVGTRDVLGFVQLCRFLPVEKDLAFRKWLASIQGRWQGIQTWMQPLPQSEGQDTSC